MILALGNGIPFFLIELARIMGCHYSMCGHVAFPLVPHYEEYYSLGFSVKIVSSF
jgi:hypothetical protein